MFALRRELRHLSLRRELRHLCARLTDRVVVKCEFQRSVVSFTFDDFPRTALEIGGRILEDAGVRGTYTVPG